MTASDPQMTATILVDAVRKHREIAGTPSDWKVEIDELSADLLTVRGCYEKPGREGGVIPGPVQADIIDTLAWMLTVYRMPPGSDAFTTDLSVQFLRPLPVGAFVAHTTMQRWSPRCAVTTLQISPGDEPVSTIATVSYAPRPPT